MSRLPDILSLIESTNDFYLMAPGRNDRSVYIQVDDLCELAMKSWLDENVIRRRKACTEKLKMLGLVKKGGQENSLNDFFDGELKPIKMKEALGVSKDTKKRELLNKTLREYGNLAAWSLDKETGGFKVFRHILTEIKEQKPTTEKTGAVILKNQSIHDLLDRINSRRTKRNAFFHDHKQAGLTVEQPECLHAIVDLYRLCEWLFDGVYRAEAEKSERALLRVQCTLIRLKHLGMNRERPLELYTSYLRRQASISLSAPSSFFESRFIHSDAFAVRDQLQALFDAEAVACQNVINRVSEMKRPNDKHKNEKHQAEANGNACKEVLRECFGIEWSPPSM